MTSFIVPGDPRSFRPPATGIVRQMPGTYGTARFLTPLEMLGKGYLERPTGKNARPSLGYVMDDSLGSPRLSQVYGELIHNIFVGPTGSGKSTQFMITTALTHPYGLLVNDLKGEVYMRAAGARAQLMKRRQVLLSCNAVTPDQTDFINPLESIRVDRSRSGGGIFEARDCKVLVQLMAEEASQGDNKIWERWASKHLAGCIQHMLTTDLSSLPIADDGGETDALVRERSFMELERLLTLQNSAAAALARNMIASSRENIRSAGRGLLSALQGDGKMYAGIKGFATDLVEPWRDPMVRQMTYRALREGPGSEPAPSTSRFSELRADVDIYLVTPAQDLRLFKAVQRVMIGLAVDELARTPRLPGTPPVQIMLDEFPQLGRMAPIEDWILYSRGYSVLFNFFVQDLEVMNTLYPGRWKSFENSSNKIFFAVYDADTAEYVERHLGQTTVRDESHSLASSRSRGHTDTHGGSSSYTHGRSSSSGPQGGTFGSSSSSTDGTNWSTSMSQTDTLGMTQSVGYAGRSLMTASEIMTMGRHEALVFVRGERPMKLLRIPFYMFEDLKIRSEISPPRRLPFADFMGED